MLIVARYFSWNEDRMNDWFTNISKYEYELGLKSRPESYTDPKQKASLLMFNKSQICFICCEKMKIPFSLSCGHTFCKNCWKDFILSLVMSKTNCCAAGCMQAGCNM